MRLPSNKEIVARLQAWDEAAYEWFTSLTVGRSSWFCGGYGLGLAAMAIGPGSAPALPWLGIAGCLFLAGLAHDNEGSATDALPEPAPSDLTSEDPPPFEPRKCMPPEYADMVYPCNAALRSGAQPDIVGGAPLSTLVQDEGDTQESAADALPQPSAK